MAKPKILFQLDPDPQPSTFDSVVAIDSGVDHLLAHGNVTLENIESLVHGAMFTRGPDDLKCTALFFGGSNVQVSEAIVKRASKCFFGPLRVSFMSDPNGSNTTAAAAVLCAEKHESLAGKTIAVLAGTGPVGQRVAQIIANRVAGEKEEKTIVRVCSRQKSKAELVCAELRAKTNTNIFTPIETATSAEALQAVSGADIIFAAGAAGVELLPAEWTILDLPTRIAIDLNAVPPAGIASIDVMDKAEQRGNTICYGAIGVGGLKMKIHKQCIASLFESNDRTLEVNEIYEIGRQLA